MTSDIYDTDHTKDNVNSHQTHVPFHLKRAYGYNKNVNVINLHNEETGNIFFYAASNCGIVYDWTSHDMRILQGHKNNLIDIASTSYGKWLVTADSGNENSVTIWDSADLLPVRTLFCPHKEKPLANIAISEDAKYLLTLASSHTSILKWWIWSNGKETEDAIITIDEPRSQIISIAFTPTAEHFFITTRTDIIVGLVEPVSEPVEDVVLLHMYEMKVTKPENQTKIYFGTINCSVFAAKSNQILCVTSEGYVFVYGHSYNYQENIMVEKITDMKFVKVLKIQSNSINTVIEIDNVIVTGNDIGEIHFYDTQFKILYWIEGFSFGSIFGISFNISQEDAVPLILPKDCKCLDEPTDATKNANLFVMKDFIISSSNGIGMFQFLDKKYTRILSYSYSPVITASSHPERSLICVGYESGEVEIIDYKQNQSFKKIQMPNVIKNVGSEKMSNITQEQSVPVSCIQYSPSGLHLACGMANGSLWFLDPVFLTMKNNEPNIDTKHSIKEICYSEDSNYLAFSDEGRTVCVYKYECDTTHWEFVAKHRAHYKDISSILFTQEKNDGFYKLFSFGQDRIMVEYDLASSANEYLNIFSIDRTDQTSVLLAATNWPAPQGAVSDKKMMLIATDEFKFKIVNHINGMTMATYLGPCYGTPVCKLILFSPGDNKVENRPTYVLFSNKNIIGLQKLPLDGNPSKHIGILGHAEEVRHMCISHDGSIVFTIGADDPCFLQWDVNIGFIENKVKEVGDENKVIEVGVDKLKPYYCLLEESQASWLLQEMHDLFYYVQVLCQGKYSTTKRMMTNHIPIETLPDLMRAVGFFPSQYELENLLVEAKFKVYNTEAESEITFEDTVILYLNHRPAIGETLSSIESAFNTFATLNKFDNKYFMGKEAFIDFLMKYGEQFSRVLTDHLLKTLVTQYTESKENLPNINDEYFPYLPEKITFEYFAQNILGIQILADGSSSNVTRSTEYSSSVTE